MRKPTSQQIEAFLIARGLKSTWEHVELVKLILKGEMFATDKAQTFPGHVSHPNAFWYFKEEGFIVERDDKYVSNESPEDLVEEIMSSCSACGHGEFSRDIPIQNGSSTMFKACRNCNTLKLVRE